MMSVRWCGCQSSFQGLFGGSYRDKVTAAMPITPLFYLFLAEFKSQPESLKEVLVLARAERSNMTRGGCF
jgi:hypothetical protein